jgi:hypothetical protein
LLERGATLAPVVLLRKGTDPSDANVIEWCQIDSPLVALEQNAA